MLKIHNFFILSEIKQMDFINFKNIWITFNQVVNYNYAASDAAISVAFELLGGYPERDLLKALKEAVKSAEYQIKVSDVIKILNSFSGLSDTELELKAQRAFNTMKHILESYSVYRDYLFEDKVISEIIDGYGGINAFYELEWNDYFRSKFIKQYIDIFRNDAALDYKILNCRFAVTSVILVPDNYQNKSFTLTKDQAQKMIDNPQLFGKKIEYLKMLEDKKKLLLENKEKDKSEAEYVSKERIDEAFQKILEAFSKK